MLARVGKVDPASLDDYRRTAVPRALPRGGDGPGVGDPRAHRVGALGAAARPSPGRRCGTRSRRPPRTRHVVCNADESEPGTFKDRVLMEGDLRRRRGDDARGLRRRRRAGWIYLRAGTPSRPSAPARDRPRAAARHSPRRRRPRAGLSLRHRGPPRRGAYICGEETALLNSIEGYRGEPRSNRPSPWRWGSSGSRRSSTTSRRSPTRPSSSARARRRSRGGHEGVARHEALLPVGRGAAPGRVMSSLRRDARRTHRARGRFREGRSLRGCCSAARPGASWAPDALGLPLTLEDSRRRGRDARVGWCSWSTTRWPWARSSGASRPSSATSRAASASPAASAPCARRSSSPGSPRAPHGDVATDDDGAAPGALAQAMRDAPILRPRADGVPAQWSRFREAPRPPARRSAPMRHLPVVPTTAPPERPVELTVDGRAPRVPEGATIFRRLPRSASTPTLCQGRQPHARQRVPVCVVELQGRGCWSWRVRGGSSRGWWCTPLGPRADGAQGGAREPRVSSVGGPSLTGPWRVAPALRRRPGGVWPRRPP